MRRRLLPDKACSFSAKCLLTLQGFPFALPIAGFSQLKLKLRLSVSSAGVGIRGVSVGLGGAGGTARVTDGTRSWVAAQKATWPKPGLRGPRGRPGSLCTSA